MAFAGRSHRAAFLERLFWLYPRATCVCRLQLTPRHLGCEWSLVLVTVAAIDTHNLHMQNTVLLRLKTGIDMFHKNRSKNNVYSGGQKIFKKGQTPQIGAKSQENLDVVSPLTLPNSLF